MPPADPTIALDINAGRSNELSNPLSMVESFAKIQNELNTARLFNQTFRARQGLGEIFATSPDMATASARAAASPWAAWAPDTAKAMFDMERTRIETANSRQQGAQSAFQFMLRNSAGGIVDPSQRVRTLNMTGALADPQYRDALKSAGGTWLDYLGNPNDPTTGGRVGYNARYNAGLIGAGMTPEAVAGVTGSVTMVPGMQPNTGLRTTQPTLVPPGPVAAAGAQPSPIGPGIVEGLTPGQAIETRPGPLQSDLRPSTVTGQQIFTGQVPGTPNLAAGGALAPSGANAANAPNAPNALAPPGASLAAPSPAVGFQASPAPGQTATTEGAAKTYQEEGARAYNSAITGLGSIQYMRRAFDQLEGTGFTTPGTAANARLSVVRGINTLSAVFGGQPLVDPGKVATWEELHKESQRAGMQLVNQMFGAQRESQLIYQAAASAVPRIENTPAGARLILASLEQVMSRQVDLRNWETNWAQQHAGNLVGAQEAFNQRFTPDLYSKKAISTVDPIEVASPEDAAKYLPGTIVVRKGTNARFRVTPSVSSVVPPQLGGQ